MVDRRALSAAALPARRGARFNQTASEYAVPPQLGHARQVTPSNTVLQSGSRQSIAEPRSILNPLISISSKQLQAT